MTFSIAHISDLHVPPLPKVRAADLLSKRILGYLSWHRKRKYQHRQEVLHALQADLKECRPDHICVTGDLTNISLPGEFTNAAHWLKRFGPADKVSVIPGNHDAYVIGAFEKSAGLWESWMCGDNGKPTFPYVRRRDGVAIIGLSTAVATLPALASGRLGKAQCARLEALLSKEHEAGNFTVVMIHHPPVTGVESRRKGLTDQAEFRAVINRVGAGLVLHGHSHKAMLHHLDGPYGAVPVLGAGSSSSIGGRKGPGHYFLITIAQHEKGVHLRAEDRHFDATKNGFISAGMRDLGLLRAITGHHDSSS